MQYFQKWSKQTLWICIFGLVIINCLSIAILAKQQPSVASQEVVSILEDIDDVVAEVGDVSITKVELMGELEKRYGINVLQELINKTVVTQLAEKYDVTVSDEEVEREWQLIKTIYQHNANFATTTDEDMKEHIRLSLQLEELLIKDVTIPEEEIKEFFEQNKDLYNIPESFQLAHIVVNSEESAIQVINELKEGSSFSVLAMEKSTDELTANSGGELGYLSKQYLGSYPEMYIEEAAKINNGEWTNPIELNDKYVILYLHEKLPATTFQYEDVKDQVRRMLALEQIGDTMRVEMFWNEVGVTWLYDENY